MKTEFRANLAAHNTFGLTVFANELALIQTMQDIESFAEKAHQAEQWQMLGGGSNVVITKDLAGLTGLIKTQGKRLVGETSTDFLLEAQAGENWHDWVTWTLDQGYPGLENLALIPGTVGAAPIQNIGAYGAEMASFFDHLLAWDMHHHRWVELGVSDCQFAYRTSIFKADPKRYIVAQVVFKLPKRWTPQLGYEPLAQALKHRAPTPRAIYDAVCEIRKSKLPDWRELGNTGSFFHNPVVDSVVYERLKAAHPELVAYPYQDGFKLAAGWLIERCGLKGYRLDSVGVYEKQALVLVNYGQATGEDILRLAKTIQDKVQEQFGVLLSIEPVIY